MSLAVFFLQQYSIMSLAITASVLHKHCHSKEILIFVVWFIPAVKMNP